MEYAGKLAADIGLSQVQGAKIVEIVSAQDYFMDDATLLPMEALDAKFARYSLAVIRCGSSQSWLGQPGSLTNPRGVSRLRHFVRA